MDITSGGASSFLLLFFYQFYLARRLTGIVKNDTMACRFQVAVVDLEVALALSQPLPNWRMP